MRLAILDRDGVINEDSDDYIKAPEEWRPIPGSLEAIARLNHSGYRVLVVTNQSGIGRGLFDIEALHRIHDRMRAELHAAGGQVEAVFFCPHRPEDDCPCRKPRPGLLQDLAARLRVSLDGVPAIGDSARDLEAALAVGARPILVRTGKGAETAGRAAVAADIPVYENLSAAVDALLDHG